MKTSKSKRPKPKPGIPAYVKDAKLITSVHVPGEDRPRPVFYVSRPPIYYSGGKLCRTPLELGVALARAIESRDAEGVAGFCWDALNFVHNGKVPRNWLGAWRKAGPTPLIV